jgi:hypothetical protein
MLSGELEAVPTRKGPCDCLHQPQGLEASGGLAPEAHQPHSTRPATSLEGAVMDMRELKGLDLAARSRIEFRDGAWQVPSQSTNGTYRVTLSPEGDRCECDDFNLTAKPCKHIHAARIVRERDGGKAAPSLELEVIPKRPTFKQDWPAYNYAQATEKRRVRILLQDLCCNLPERERSPNRRGPKPHLVRDAVFAMAYKVYCGLSSRRFSTDLLEAHEKGFVSKPIPGAKVTAFFEDDYFTPILKELIGYSARPLRSVETDFSIDSSGFGSCRYEKWYDQKYGITRNKCVWVTASSLSTVITCLRKAIFINNLQHVMMTLERLDAVTPYRTGPLESPSSIRLIHFLISAFSASERSSFTLLP